MRDGNRHWCSLTIFAAGFVNVILFLTTRRVLPMYSVIPRSIYRLFGSSATSVSSRATSYSTTSSFSADIEKPLSPYNESMIQGEFPIDALPSAAYTRHTPASPMFTIGTADSETYDILALSSAEARRRSFTQEVDISSAPYTGGHHPSGVWSPTISVPVPIRSGEFSPEVGISPLDDGPSRLHGPRPLHGGRR